MKFIVGVDEAGRAAPPRRGEPRSTYIIGVDEVGRGPLAGPVAAAAAAVPPDFKFKILNFKLKDSKKLTKIQREKWFEFLTKNPRIFWAAASVSEKTIDKINIQNASELAMKKAVKKLETKLGKRLTFANCRILVDGNRKIKNFNLPQKTIIKGDEKIPVISAASIIAKVIRDRFMVKLHGKYPRYDFAKHKGYGTKEHYRALKKFGTSPVHRRSFRLQ